MNAIAVRLHASKTQHVKVGAIVEASVSAHLPGCRGHPQRCSGYLPLRGPSDTLRQPS
jgi:hypothetical protein